MKNEKCGGGGVVGVEIDTYLVFGEKLKEIKKFIVFRSQFPKKKKNY